MADGELVIQDEQGRSAWDRLRQRHHLKDPIRIKLAAAAAPAAIFASDLLWLDGADFRRRPLLERKTALHKTLPANRRIRYAAHFADDCRDLWQLAVRMELEGIVAKRADSAYSAGRSMVWQKVKTEIGAMRERLRRP